MKISSKARSAVQALVQLARLNEKNMFISLSLLTKEDGLSLVFLEQIFLKLKNADIVISQRGANGGYQLKRLPETLSILEIIEAVDCIGFAVKCLGSKAGCRPDKSKCSTHNLWKSLDTVTRTYLSSVMLSDVAFDDCLSKGDAA